MSIAMFNYFGLSVTRHVSATARSLTDTCRTLTIWIISLGLGWEKLVFPLSLLQVLGFSLLVYGTVNQFRQVQIFYILMLCLVPFQQSSRHATVFPQINRDSLFFRRDSTSIRRRLGRNGTVNTGRGWFDVMPRGRTCPSISLTEPSPN